jgi:hypothetical protein
MKHLNKLLVAVMMVMGLSSHAQDSNNPWAISFELMPLTLERVLVVVKLGRPSFSQPFAVKTTGIFFHLFLI